MNAQKLIYVIDDDATFLSILTRRLSRQPGFQVCGFASVEAALSEDHTTVFAILLDMQLAQGNGLDGIVPLSARFAPTHLIVLTGYASIATTVEAMRRGATDYLPKPVGLNDIMQRLNNGPVAEHAATDFTPLTPAQIEREHLERVLKAHNGNISATADALKMHRRTLQRKLQRFSRGS